MEKGDFKNWEEALKFYQEEYKDFFLEEELDRILMKFNDEEYSDIQNLLLKTQFMTSKIIIVIVIIGVMMI